MERNDRFLPGASRQVGMHHVAHNRSRPDDRDFHYEVVEIFRFQTGQRSHLCPALHLEHADGVALLQRFIDQRLIRGQFAQIDFFPPVLPDQSQRVLEHRHHPQTQEVDFDDAHIGAILLIPLHDYAVRHRRRLQSNHAVELTLADHHAARMLSQVAGQVLKRNCEIEKASDFWVGKIQTGLAQLIVV